MKKTLLLFLFSIFNLGAFAQFGATSLKVFDKITFYDGYAKLSTEPVPAGVIRFRNDLFSTKLTEQQLQAFGSSMTFKVTIKAACDNYDRIANVNLALVPKGSTTYSLNEVQRIEVGRFITPFMNKNKTPDQVPYTMTADNIASLFKDPVLNANFDFWVELQVFGVPYAAQKEVSGCAGRTDCFLGTLELISDAFHFTSTNNFLLPLNFQKNLNNYKAGASDEIGKTTRTIVFDLPAEVTNANLHLITSNHGAGTNGEEYARRWHYVYFDNVQKLNYKPGEESCEPYRVYNTQGNGIYGATTKSDSQWQSFSNWCPGAKIPTRIISLGTVAAGSHSFKIDVPSAVFYNKDGNFPVSLYMQGKSTVSTLGMEDVKITSYSLYPNPTNSIINISASEEVKSVTIYNMLGQQIWNGNTNQIDLTNADSGVYNAVIRFANDKEVSEKIIRN